MRNFTKIVIVCLGTLMAAEAQAVVLSSTDFESFGLGSVNGQSGWSVTGGYDQEVVSDGGNKAFRLSDAVTSGAFGDQTFAPRPGGTGMTSADPTNSNPGFFAGQSSTGATYNRYSLSFDFKSATQQGQDDAFVSISGDNGQGGRQTYLGITANGSNLDLITYNIDALGGFVPISLGSVAASVWSHVDFVLDFGDGLNDDVVTIALNNIPVHTGTSWEQYYVINQLSLHPLGVPVQTAIFLARGDENHPSHLGGGFLFDNVNVEVDRTPAVPEPMTLSLLGAGLAGIGWVRRKRA